MKNYITILAVIAVAFLTSCNIDSKNEYTPQISTSYFLKYKIDANGKVATKSTDPNDQKNDTLYVDWDGNAWFAGEITDGHGILYQKLLVVEVEVIPYLLHQHQLLVE